MRRMLPRAKGIADTLPGNMASPRCLTRFWSVLIGASLGIACADANQATSGANAGGTTGSGGAAPQTAGSSSSGAGGNISSGSPTQAGSGGAGSSSMEHAGAGGVGGAGAGAPASGGIGGTASGSGGVGGTAPILTTKDFECTELIGLWVASQWWGSFEKGVDNARWEFMFQHHGYLELFADPQSEFWKNQVSSQCSAQAQTPDRVVFLPFSLTLNTLEQWQSNLTQVVETMKGKFPGVKRIELMTTLRSPANMPCANDTDPNTVVPPYVDEAINNVAAASGGLVTVGPKIELTSCDWWAGGTDLTGAGNTGAGELLAQYYKTH
jgi:hypothetical protein